MRAFPSLSETEHIYLILIFEEIFLVIFDQFYYHVFSNPETNPRLPPVSPFSSSFSFHVHYPLPQLSISWIWGYFFIWIHGPSNIMHTYIFLWSSVTKSLILDLVSSKHTLLAHVVFHLTFSMIYVSWDKQDWYMKSVFFLMLMIRVTITHWEYLSPERVCSTILVFNGHSSLLTCHLGNDFSYS